MFRFTVLLTLLWLPSLLFSWDKMDNFFAWRHQLTMYTGMLSLGYMGFAVLLAARFSWIEDKIKGLDKGYKLHKNLGIGATVSLFFHWLIVKSAHWLIDGGYIARPNRGPRPELEGINWHAVAEQVGDISFKVFLIFAIFSLVQAISYKKFKYTHKLGGILMLAGVFHTTFLLDWNIGTIPMNLAIAAISVVGVWCSWLSLSGSIGKVKKVRGEVTSVKPFSVKTGTNTAIRFSIKLESGINYKEGQFAYLNFHDGEAPHPFSILNYDPEQRSIDFGVKDLGDYTNKLVNTLKAGQKVTIEGGYGRFQMSEFSEQVWVGAGIGIVPFVSRLYWLKKQAEKQQVSFDKIHLFYCVNSANEAFFHNEIISLLQKLNFIELHLLEADNGQLLDGEQIMEKVKGKEFDVSFCGPDAFGKSLQSQLATAGIPEERFHKEIFKMR
ncbi:ferric reductase-like transmembrane domain-containing protein [Vibrio hannami]|uniref:ferredoxin reductase family protein n=1 Tax=Vibrio hannami TaxID=2717094 RepID=UPI00240F5634|nr:ferric reductase-like transmembrane domain-containing protein [Vibrio hannami]MDG3085889.1 ferric reductase-like transmembrane domain-containing protein [Vibrio hannami]